MHSWSISKYSLGLSYYFEARRGLCFMWDNHWNDTRILARMDRFYTSNKSINQDMLEEYCIRGNIELLDHLPMSFQLSLKIKKNQNCCYKMNLIWLSIHEVKGEITRLWNSHLEGTHFLVRYKKAIWFYNSFCWQKVENCRHGELDQGIELAGCKLICRIIWIALKPKLIWKWA